MMDSSLNTTMTTSPGASRRTVDAPTRAFHWLMAVSFAGAYASAESDAWRWLHITLGYTLAGLLVWRVLWGWWGPRQVRWSALRSKLGGLPAWLRQVRQAQVPPARHTQNLGMALAITAILALVALTTLSGYALYQDWWGEALEDVHETLGNGLLVVVLAHIGLVLAMSLWRRQNQALPMLTGRTPGPGPDLVQRNRGGWAVLMLAAVLAFWGWQWMDPPVTEGLHTSHHADHDHRHDSGSSEGDDADDDD